MKLSDWLGQVGENVGNDVLERVSEELGGPKLPPLQKITLHENPNAYVPPREAPDAPAQNFTDKAVNVFKGQKVIMYSAIAVGALLIVYLASRRK